MTFTGFLAEWALRSTLLIGTGAVLLWSFRVKDASARLTAWTALMIGSLLVPLMMLVLPVRSVGSTVIRLPKVPAGMTMDAQPRVADALFSPGPESTAALPAILGTSPAHSFAWQRLVVAIYGLVAFVLLLRLAMGVWLSGRLMRCSGATDRIIESVQVRESDRVGAPVTLGVLRPAIVLPPDWREWDTAKLDAVLVHELSHIRRRDPAVQLLSAIHRALLWHNPLSWFLHRRLVRAAEDASDDAAIGASGDGVFYAGLLLEFMQRGVRRAGWLGVQMARYGGADVRIRRILENRGVSRGMTWRMGGLIAASVLPLAWVAATVRTSLAAQEAPPPPSPAQVLRPAAVPVPAAPAPVPSPNSPSITLPVRFNGGPVTPVTLPLRIRFSNASQVALQRPASPTYLNGLGTVTAATLVVKSKVDGELMSLGFEEGKPVEAGQLLATVDAQNSQGMLARALEELAKDKQRLSQSAGQPSETVVQLENQMKADERYAETLKGAVSYGQVRAPFAGVAGLRKVDPGNFVRAGDTLVVITQIQPIAVLFNIPEDSLPEILAYIRKDANPSVEAWNRDMTVKLATGRLVAVDNEIDKSSGTVVLKATFDNKDGVLFPNQFVNARVVLNQ